MDVLDKLKFGGRSLEMQITQACQIVVTLLVFSLPVLAQDKVTYLVEYNTARKDFIHITIQPPVPLKGPVTLVIPRAIPSGYQQEFYDRYVENVKATSTSGAQLEILREDGPRWRAGVAGTNVSRLEYDVDLSRLEREIFDAASVSKVREGYVGLLGYSVLGYLEVLANSAIKLEVKAPQDWPVFTTLAPRVPTNTTTINGEAKDFYELADSQIVMGPKFVVQRLESSVPLYLLAYAEVETDLKKHAEIFADAFRKVSAYFEGTPLDHYTAYIEFLKPISKQHEYGFSMEHLNSSTYFLGIDRAITPSTRSQQLERDRFNFAHHIAHSWIPKRVYGTGYLPFTWELAPQIETIWFNEGFARYIAIEALADAMPLSEERQEFYRQQFLTYRTTLGNMPGFIREMPLLELSRVGSLMYSGDFRIGRTLFIKGMFMAYEMDRRIRELTFDKKRLRDSMRAMVKWGEKSYRAFRLEELPGLIARPVGVNEREIRVIMEGWLTGSRRAGGDIWK